jgi:hypothetical protein
MRIWNSSSGRAWAHAVPWVINQLTIIGRRQRFVRMLLWAMPERSQQVGLYVARGVDPVVWSDITADMPQIVPRGMPGWVPFM